MFSHVPLVHYVARSSARAALVRLRVPNMYLTLTEPVQLILKQIFLVVVIE